MGSDQGSYTAAVDIFSLGVVLYQLVRFRSTVFPDEFPRCPAACNFVAQVNNSLGDAEMRFSFVGNEVQRA